VAGGVCQQRLPYFFLLSFDGASDLLGSRFELVCLVCLPQPLHDVLEP
jgi:hypothetical protein